MSDYQQLYIQSENRPNQDTTGSEEFTIDLSDNLIRIPNITYIRVKDVKIPLMVYAINEYNNQIQIAIPTFNAGAYQTIELTKRNYSRSDFENEFATQCNNVFTGYTFTVNVNEYDYKLTIACQNNIGPVPQIFSIQYVEDPTYGTSLFDIMGFQKSLTYTGASEYTGGKACILNRNMFIFVRSSNVIGKKTKNEIANSNVDDLLIKVNINTDTGNYVTYEEQDIAVSKKIKGINGLGNFVGEMNLYLTMEDGTPANLNGAEWGITLLFQTSNLT